MAHKAKPSLQTDSSTAEKKSKTKGRFRGCFRSCLPAPPEEESLETPEEFMYLLKPHINKEVMPDMIEKDIPSTPLEPRRRPVNNISTEPTSEPPCEPVKTFPDKLVGSLKVHGLNQGNFRSFLKQRDATLVMFYDRKQADSSVLAEQVAMAAKCTKRANHAYAAVNCKEEEDLCMKNAVTTLPMFTLYARTSVISSIRDVTKLNADVMRNYVEQAPPVTML